jgi:hypothetical protein
LIAAQETDVHHAAEEPPGSKRGPRVNAYLRSARSMPGEPWNAAFVAWCCTEAGWNPLCEEATVGVMYPASVVSWIAWAKRTRRFKKDLPERGDLFVIDRPGRHHIGFVAGMTRDAIRTIEVGAECVTRQVRMLGQPDGFISLRTVRPSNGGRHS